MIRKSLLISAVDQFRLVLRKPSITSSDTKVEAQYLVGAAFEAMGKSSKAYVAYQKAYSIKPDYKDVAKKLIEMTNQVQEPQFEI